VRGAGVAAGPAVTREARGPGARPHDRSGGTVSSAGILSSVPLADAGAVALDVIIALSAVVPLVVLAVVGRAFFRSARRFDEEQARAGRDEATTKR